MRNEAGYNLQDVLKAVDKFERISVEKRNKVKHYIIKFRNSLDVESTYQPDGIGMRYDVRIHLYDLFLCYTEYGNMDIELTTLDFDNIKYDITKETNEFIMQRMDRYDKMK